MYEIKSEVIKWQEENRREMGRAAAGDLTQVADAEELENLDRVWRTEFAGFLEGIKNE